MVTDQVLLGTNPWVLTWSSDKEASRAGGGGCLLLSTSSVRPGSRRSLLEAEKLTVNHV